MWRYVDVERGRHWDIDIHIYILHRYLALPCFQPHLLDPGTEILCSWVTHSEEISFEMFQVLIQNNQKCREEWIKIDKIHFLKVERWFWIPMFVYIDCIWLPYHVTVSHVMFAHVVSCYLSPSWTNLHQLAELHRTLPFPNRHCHLCQIS